MKFSKTSWQTLLLSSILSFGALAAEPWRPVDPAQLSLQAPAVDKDAGAEVIWWDIRVEKEDERAVVSHYLRIKIFNERGRESQSTVELPYFDKYRVRDVAARTIKPDGQIVNLNPADIFDKQVLRAGKFKLNVISFALPGVEPGALIEYRWIEEYKASPFVKLELQRDIPMQSLKLTLKGKSSYPAVQRMKFYHMSQPIFRDETKDFRSTTLTNIPAFTKEPLMPCLDCVRPWVLLYTTYTSFYADGYWDALGKELYQEMAGKTKPNDELRRAASEIIGTASTAEQKLERLHEFCRLNLRNYDDPRLTESERAGYRENKSATELLHSKFGTGREINLLFAALAGAAGFNARLAVLAERGERFFDAQLTDTYYMALLLNSNNVAVEVAGQWRFFDPGSPYVSFGMLRWQEEGRSAFVTDPVRSTFVTTPLSAPEKTQYHRSGKLKLDADGTLEGDVRTEYTGHTAVEFRLSDLALTPQQREDDLSKQIKARVNNAEVTNIKLENLTDPTKPLVYSYHLRVPNYAQRTGKRLIFAPNYFMKGRQAMFSASTRKYPVVFSYPWVERDELTLELPAGFELDHADAPTPLRVEKVAAHEVKMGVTQDGRTLVYERNFFFGGEEHLAFPAQVYEKLKQVFDAFYQNDNHQLTLKQAALAAAQ